MFLEVVILVVGPVLRIIEFFLFKLVSTKIRIFQVLNLLHECKNKNSSKIAM